MTSHGHRFFSASQRPGKKEVKKGSEEKKNFAGTGVARPLPSTKHDADMLSSAAASGEEIDGPLLSKARVQKPGACGPVGAPQLSFDTDLDEVCRLAAQHALAKPQATLETPPSRLQKFSRNTQALATLETPPPRLGSLENSTSTSTAQHRSQPTAG